MQEYDERYDDEHDPPAAPSFPAGVKTAGFIWIAFGALGIIMQVVTLGMKAAQGNPASPCCGFLFAIAFLIVGVHTIQGKATGMIGNGIGSIVFSLLYFGLAAGVLFLDLLPKPQGERAEEAQMILQIVGAICGLLGFLLFLAGVLAIVGHGAYVDWRAEFGPQRSRRSKARRDRESYDEDEDR